jgi:hypothetical protein
MMPPVVQTIQPDVRCRMHQTIMCVTIIAVVGLGRWRPADAQSCVGDCNGDSVVAVSEVIVGVNIDLGTSALATCASFDVDHNSSVDITEIVQAVANAVCGCNVACGAASPTPTPTLSEPTPPQVGQILFREGWEAAAVQRYAPESLFGGDTGAWLIDDSITGDPDCGNTSRNYAQVVVEDGSRRLQLHSERHDTFCADNVFVGPVTQNPPGPRELDIPVDDSVYLSFHETGALLDPDPCDAVTLSVEFDHEVDIDYVLQRGTRWETFPGSCGGIFVADPLLLPTDRASFVRNLNEDAALVGILPVHHVTYIGLNVDSHGDATFDDVTFFRAADAPSPPPTQTPTPTPLPGPCTHVQQGTWCFEFPGLEEEGPLSQSGCFIDFDFTWKGTLSGSSWQVSLGDTPAATLSGTFGGNPATQFQGRLETEGATYGVTGSAGACPE